MSVNLEALSAEERANFGSITPLAASLKDVGSAAYNFMLPVFAAFFARGLGGEEAFMSGFAGGYLASQSSAGFLGAIFCAVVSAVVCNLMRGIIDESPKTVQRVAPILIYPLFSLTIMYLILRLLLEPLTGLIDAQLTAMLMTLRDSDSQELLGAALGAMMATDMGGPINKCAYHFGLAAIDAGAYQTMAQVMVAGMVPPCGIAFAMLAFPTRFSRAERDRGAATLIMGLGFITEGAIPFAITDPIRIIGASMAGSAAAAVVSSSLGCTLMAPHGGIFVFPVVGNPLGYATALFAGSALSALILGLTRPALEDA
jgi:PTS system fructose-specific IIC component